MISEWETVRVGEVTLGDAQAVVLAIIERIRQKYGIDVPIGWWEDKQNHDYDLVVLLFVAPFKGAVRIADVDADPLAFDYALHQVKVCQECHADQLRVVEGKVVGMADCPLGKDVPVETGRTLADGRPELVWVKHGADSAYIDVQALTHGWQWRAVICKDSELRKNEIAGRLNKFTKVGGMKARPVDGPTPFDERVRAATVGAQGGGTR